MMRELTIDELKDVSGDGVGTSIGTNIGLTGIRPWCSRTQQQ